MKPVTIFITAILVFGFLFNMSAEKTYSQPVPFEGCCQFDGSCENLAQEVCFADPLSLLFFIDSECNESTGVCPRSDVGDSEARSVPTLSEWGLIAMAGVLGLVGFIVIHRRKVTA